MDREYAEYLLKKTKEDYNLIAEDWASVRKSVSPEEKAWLFQYIMDGEKVLDLGCGHGRYAEVLKEKNINYFGVDIAEKMIAIAKEKYPFAKFQTSDFLKLPFPEGFFDKVICFAVFHHIPSETFRIQFLQEIKRVLKKNGILILTIWNLNPLNSLFIGQRKRFFSFLKSTILKIFGKSRLDFKDFYIPWRNICQRYVHWFSKNELKNLFKKADFEIKKIDFLKNPKTKESNIYLIAEK